MNSSVCSMTSINPGHCEKAASVAKIPFPEKCWPGIEKERPITFDKDEYGGQETV